MAFGPRELSRWAESATRAAAKSMQGFLALADARALEPPIAARLRAAQVAAVTRHSWAMIGANFANALVLVAAMFGGPHFVAALIWIGALALYLGPLVWRLHARRGRSPPVTAEPRVIQRAVVNAGLLGLIWGAAPVLFFDSGPGEQLIFACVCTGMLCGGAFAMATIPAAVLAYVLPIGGGAGLALLLEARETVEYFAAPLLLSYSAVLIIGSSSHGRNFADRVVAQARAELAARHDPLTGLPNRTAFNAAIDDAFDRLARYGERFALFYIDLDDFKDVNDRWGHQAGDQLLRQAAGRLADSLNERGSIARLGGDEFALIARGVFEPQAASNLAFDIACRFDAPFTLESGVANCGASVGAALAPTDGADASSLLGAADVALYRAKRDLKGSAPLYRAPDDGKALNRRELTHDMRAAVGRGEFFLQYQPIQNLRSGRIEACEALVRWRHPRLGLIAPGKFIEIAEKTGFIHELGEWILIRACVEAAAWPVGTRVAVNVSAQQLCDGSIDRVVESALRHSGLAADRLQIEVTESAALAAIEEATSALLRMHDRGAAVVLDDFGTGFSSFDHIRRLPVSGVKIDRSFVLDLPANRRSGAIVHAVAHLAQMLDLDVTAEGIETEQQRAFLERAGCASGQGYLFARPLDASDARARLRTSQPPARTAA